MTAAAEALRYVQLAVFLVTAALATLRWYRRRGVTGTPGSGLGLAISRRLANDLGGDLAYDTTAPGARFVVRLGSAR